MGSPEEMVNASGKATSPVMCTMQKLWISAMLHKRVRKGQELKETDLQGLGFSLL